MFTSYYSLGTLRLQCTKNRLLSRCSHHLAAGVGLAGLLVEHLAGHGEVTGFVDQAVQLLPPLQHALNGLVQDDLGLVQIPLDLGQLVCLGRILRWITGVSSILCLL